MRKYIINGKYYKCIKPFKVGAFSVGKIYRSTATDELTTREWNWDKMRGFTTNVDSETFSPLFFGEPFLIYECEDRFCQCPSYRVGEEIVYKYHYYRITDIEELPDDYVYKVECIDEWYTGDNEHVVDSIKVSEEYSYENNILTQNVCERDSYDAGGNEITKEKQYYYDNRNKIEHKEILLVPQESPMPIDEFVDRVLKSSMKKTAKVFLEDGVLVVSWFDWENIDEFNNRMKEEKC